MAERKGEAANVRLDKHKADCTNHRVLMLGIRFMDFVCSVDTKHSYIWRSTMLVARIAWSDMHLLS